jgi:hypothetical protein
VSPDLIGGHVDEGYGKVADAFRANFASSHEVGAAIAVYRNGAKVVDLSGPHGMAGALPAPLRGMAYERKSASLKRNRTTGPRVQHWSG